MVYRFLLLSLLLFVVAVEVVTLSYKGQAFSTRQIYAQQRSETLVTKGREGYSIVEGSKEDGKATETHNKERTN